MLLFYLISIVSDLVLFLVPPALSASGGWAATYGGVGGDWSHSIQQTRDGGYIVAGTTSSFGAGKEDLWVLKLRPDGTVEWQKTYGGYSYERAHSICETRDGGYIVAGYSESFPAIGKGTDCLHPVSYYATYGFSSQGRFSCSLSKN